MISIKLLATALTFACPTERLEDTLIDRVPGRCMVLLMTNKKIMDGLA